MIPVEQKRLLGGPEQALPLIEGLEGPLHLGRAPLGGGGVGAVGQRGEGFFRLAFGHSADRPADGLAQREERVPACLTADR